ncbi:MAG: helix-turn-helix domain-containing protein [Candidatus Diapherotrites archaeon]|nr:helix-turn-helix domain-containing protein [Candidatus Diapherotrites archaeon]
MDERILRIRSLFSNAISGFGLMHAKIYHALMFGDVKTAKQLSHETQISINKIYQVLKDLIREKIIASTGTDPTTYYAINAVKDFEKIIERKVNQLQRLPKELQKLIEIGTTACEFETEYIIRFDGKQTKLIDNKNKSLVKETQEAKQLIQQLNDYIKAIEPKKDNKFLTYRL